MLDAVTQELSDYYFAKCMRRNEPMQTYDSDKCECRECNAIADCNRRFYEAMGYKKRFVKTTVWCGHVDHYGTPCDRPEPSRALFKEETIYEPTVPNEPPPFNNGGSNYWGYGNNAGGNF